MNCDANLPTTHVKLAEGDQNSANHLQLSRKIAPQASIDLGVCAADLTVRGGKTDLLQVTVDITNPAPKLTAGDYLQALDVTPQGVSLRIHLPKRPLAKVVVLVPAMTQKLAVNLVRGDVSFETDRIGGDRNINVVSGHVEFLGNSDSYETFQVNVLMGSFHDRRQGGGGPVMVSRSLSGAGKGSVEINVVRGSVDLKPWD